jgi:hypothetical protein
MFCSLDESGNRKVAWKKKYFLLISSDADYKKRKPFRQFGISIASLENYLHNNYYTFTFDTY